MPHYTVLRFEDEDEDEDEDDDEGRGVEPGP